MASNSSQRNVSPEKTFTITDDINEDDAQQFQRIIRDRQDEREDIQKKAFTKWINNQLGSANSTLAVEDLFQDLRDGIILLRLLEILTGNEYKRENGKMRVHHIGNVNKVISILNEHGIKLLSISSNDIVDGHPKLTLALIWSIIQYWQGRDVIKSVQPDSKQTNIEKFLLSWCQKQTEGYKSVEINDFTQSWKDGLAFNALIHKFRPDLFDYEELLQNAAARNLEHAFSVAKNVFKVDRYLDVEDVLAEQPDKKSILMYVMCLFQQLPSTNIVIEEKEKDQSTTTIINTKEAKSPSTKIESTQFSKYQQNIERILSWILKLEDMLDRQENNLSDDLKVIKEQFQNHEEFMVSLTKDQNQIGDVLQEGNHLLTSTEINLQAKDKSDIKEQMTTLNRRWESLRLKSLERQTILHKTLMKLQIDQIDSFDQWLNQTEKLISKDLEVMEENLPGIERQYQQLAQLQDELVSQQQITESLQNMIIVIDDSPSEDLSLKYNSSEIENKLLNLSERWARICNFVQHRWIELQEVKIELEQIDINRQKIDQWFEKKENEFNKIKSDSSINDNQKLLQHIHTIQKIESEMGDVRQLILSLDNSLKVLSNHYDSKISNVLKDLNERVNNFETRWTKLIDDYEQCSTQLKKVNLSTQTSVKSESDVERKTVSTTIEEKTTTKKQIDETTDKTQTDDFDNSTKLEFDISMEKYFEWIKSIDRILEDFPTDRYTINEKVEIIQEIKAKYTSYDDQFKTFMQTGNAITKQLKDANKDSIEHETSLKTLEKRWEQLDKSIIKHEKDIAIKFNEELDSLTKIHNEYQTWIDSPSSTSNNKLQVKLETIQENNERFSNLRHMAYHFDSNTVQRAEDLLRSWDETHSRLRETNIPVDEMQQQTSGTNDFGTTTYRQTSSTSVPISSHITSGTSDFGTTAYRQTSSTSGGTDFGTTSFRPTGSTSGGTDFGTTSFRPTGSTSGIGDYGETTSTYYQTNSTSVPVTVRQTSGTGDYGTTTTAYRQTSSTTGGTGDYGTTTAYRQTGSTSGRTGDYGTTTTAYRQTGSTSGGTGDYGTTTTAYRQTGSTSGGTGDYGTTAYRQTSSTSGGAGDYGTTTTSFRQISSTSGGTDFGATSGTGEFDGTSFRQGGSTTIPIGSQQISGTTDYGTTSHRQTGITSVPISSNRFETSERTVTTTTTTTGGSGEAGTGLATSSSTGAVSNLGPSVGENGSVFTLTNIYTFGGDGSSHSGLSDPSDKYRVNSYVEVFNQPTSSQSDSAYERHYRETHSSSSVTRKIRKNTGDDYDQGDDIDSTHYRRPYDITGPSTTKHIYEHRSTSAGSLSSLPSTFTDAERKLRLWLEHVEKSLLNDKARIADIHMINVKRKVCKDLIDQTGEQKRNLENLSEMAREYYVKLAPDVSRQLQEEIHNYQIRLADVKAFLNDRLTKYDHFDKMLRDFESGVEEVRVWIRNAQPRLATSDTTSRGLENQLGRNQVLQQEISEMQTKINRLNRDIIDLTQDADDNLARRLRDQMQQLNESWSHMISSTKAHSQNLQDALKRIKLLEDNIRELEDWIINKEREAFMDDGSVFYQEQLRERLEQYQRLQTEISRKEPTIRALVDQARHDTNQPSSPELTQSLDILISNWSNLQKKVDNKVAFYTDLYKLHEELKDLLNRENIWLDSLQTRIFRTSTSGADAEETSEELDSLERFVKTHSKINYDKITEIANRLQTTKVSLPSTNSQINQFHIRWDQLHEDALRKIHSLSSQVADYQQLGQQITKMFEWIRHTDNTLNARLKDNVYAGDVPQETEKLNSEFIHYERFLQTIEDKIHGLRIAGKDEAAKRLEQQFLLLKNQFSQLQNKFRQFKKPSDFDPKYARVRQILQDIEQNMHTLEIHSDDPDVIHSQTEHCAKLHKTLSDIKPEVENVIRIGRGIVEKGQIDESSNLTRQIDQLKTTFNNLGTKISKVNTQLNDVERHLRKFQKEYSLTHEWFVKADHEIRKIENKQISKNTKEEVDWIRTTRNDIRKLEANFETLRSLERTIQKEAEKQMPSLYEKTTELKRQIDHLDRRLKDRLDIVEGQVRKLDDEYDRFIRVYQDIIIRLEKLETLLTDAERVLDLSRISQVQEELRSVRTQLNEILDLGQELVSKSEKYSKRIGPDIENITRKFEDLQHRIRIIQERTAHDRTDYEEIERIIRETEEHACTIERTDVEQARRVREKIRRLRDYLETLKRRSDHYQSGDETFRYKERFSEHIRRSEQPTPAPKERELDSDFIYDIDDTRSVISEPAPHLNTKYRKTVHSLERYKTDDHGRYFPTREEYQLQPLLRVRSLKAIGQPTSSAPSSPILQPRYRSYERSNVQYTKQGTNQQGFQDNYQTSISKSASMPNGGFPLHQNFLPQPPPPPNFYYPGPMTYRERVIDRHVAEKSTSRGESHRQQHQESSGQIQQHQESGGQIRHQHQESGGQIRHQHQESGRQTHQQQVRSSSAGGQTSSMSRSIPVRYEASNANSNFAGSSTGFRSTTGNYSQEQHPTYFFSEQQRGGSGFYPQQFYDQQTHSQQNVGRHPTRIAN